MGHQHAEIDQRVVTWDPPRTVAWVHEAEGLAGRPAPRFAASTRLEIAVGAGARGWLRVVVMRAFAGRERAGTRDRSLDALAAPR